MVRNALADPFVLGISSGAAVGADAVLIFGALGALGIWALSTAAVSALLAMRLVDTVARTERGLTPLRLVLTGTAMYYGFSAVTTFMVFAASRRGGPLRDDVAARQPGAAPTSTSTDRRRRRAAAGLAHLGWSAQRLNALAMGDETAAALGVDPGRLRKELFLVSAAVGAVVAVSGAIGFVGLMVPHAVRMLVGADHRRVLLQSRTARVLLIWVDILSPRGPGPGRTPGRRPHRSRRSCFILLMRQQVLLLRRHLMRIDIDALTVETARRTPGGRGDPGAGEGQLRRRPGRPRQKRQVHASAVRLPGLHPPPAPSVSAVTTSTPWRPGRAPPAWPPSPQDAVVEFDFTVAEIVAMGVYAAPGPDGPGRQDGPRPLHRGTGRGRRGPPGRTRLPHPLRRREATRPDRPRARPAAPRPGARRTHQPPGHRPPAGNPRPGPPAAA
ncbi:Vitamin B12 import system permease protein BtuC [Streptomyces cyaneofuscatus]